MLNAINVVGILPTSRIYGKQIVVEDEDQGVIVWEVGTILPNDYFPIMEVDVCLPSPTYFKAA